MSAHRPTSSFPASDRFTLRAATYNDAPAIARIHVETWRSAYADILPSDFLADLSVDQRLKGWKRNLTHHRRSSVQVAEVQGRLVGWVSSGQCRDEGREEAKEAEVYAIYVDAAYQRFGIGRALLRCCEAELAASHPDAHRISLWVLERNSRARAFYETEGYNAGQLTKVEPIGGRAFTELRYEKALIR